MLRDPRARSKHSSQDRNYRSPGWLRADLTAFLAGRAGGVWWLQAATHVGKTTCVQGLEPASRPIGPRLSPLKPDNTDNTDNRPVVAFYLSKEHRFGIGGLIAGLRERLARLYPDAALEAGSAMAARP